MHQQLYFLLQTIEFKYDHDYCCLVCMVSNKLHQPDLEGTPVSQVHANPTARVV